MPIKLFCKLCWQDTCKTTQCWSDWWDTTIFITDWAWRQMACRVKYYSSPWCTPKLSIFFLTQKSAQSRSMFARHRINWFSVQLTICNALSRHETRTSDWKNIIRRGSPRKLFYRLYLAHDIKSKSQCKGFAWVTTIHFDDIRLAFLLIYISLNWWPVIRIKSLLSACS